MSSPERISRARALTHTWRVTEHSDSHHTYEATLECEVCGGHAVTLAERSPQGYGLLLMRPDSCERCAALIGGARRAPMTIEFVAGAELPCHERDAWER